MQTREGSHPTRFPSQAHKQTIVGFIPFFVMDDRVELNIKPPLVLLCLYELMNQSLVPLNYSEF